MDISNEMIAAYAEGNLPEEDLPAVRKYLSEHPDELEDVLLLMDSSFSSFGFIGDTNFSKISKDSVFKSFKTQSTQVDSGILAKEMPSSHRKKNDIMSNITKLLKEIM
jgi:hypothetical protein